ncbi:MAG TPA: proprotein convertase P-domain-containing protein, partial [Herpetosiphonaceae bacterium]|nr:proprotein convertase P-domain-containing protein [Herpetosiphonaceae bacterium]
MHSHHVRALTTLLIAGALLFVGAFAPRSPLARPLDAPAPRALAMIPTGQNLLKESEPNNIRSQATPILASEAVLRALIYGTGDVDYFAISIQAGDRLHAATMTSGSAPNTSNDTFLDLLAPDGSVLETDNDDGSFSAMSSAIGSAELPTAGTYYLRVRVNGVNPTVRFYDLHVQVQRGPPAPETEPNNVAAPQPLPASGFASGAIGAAGDSDAYTLSLNPGDTIFASLDMDPERDGATWNGRLNIAPFNGLALPINDGNTTSPNAEAAFMTVKQAGTYAVSVDSAVAAAGGPALTYLLSVGVHRAQMQNCSSYASAAGSLAIGPGAGATQSTITVPDPAVIGDLNITLALTHSIMTELDVSLTAPDGNVVALFTDIGATTANAAGGVEMDLVLDDEAAIPINSFTNVGGMKYQLERDYRLAWFDGQQAAGAWTLRIVDDTGNATGGTLQGWGLQVCSAPPPPLACPPGSDPITVYGADFEAGDGGFTHSGTADNWAWGVPTAAPIAAAHSGAKAWKTNLSGTYSSDSSQELYSPAIDLSGVVAPVQVFWYQKYQMENATFDQYVVQAVPFSGTTVMTGTLFEWLDHTMTTQFGFPATAIDQSAGWGVSHADISAFAGGAFKLRFHLDSDSVT